MTDSSEVLVRAFPPQLAAAARAAISRLPSPHLPPSDSAIGPVRIGEQLIHIPARIYLRHEFKLDQNDEPSIEDRIAICLWTRHHDGYQRERSLKALLPIRAVWEVPFVVQLVGEYVVEIISAIEARLSDAQRPLFASFLRENGEFVGLTRRRLISYWNCYHRTRWVRLAEYPGMRVMKRLEDWATFVHSSEKPRS